MNRPWQIWGGFGLCLVVLLGTMGWTCRIALQAERAEFEVRRHADLEENIRLALWRMESALTPLIAEESTRPYFVYSSFYPPERAYTRMFNVMLPGEVLVPSPLLTEVPRHVLVHFQIGPDGSVTSPQVPAIEMRELAEAGFTTSAEIEAANTRVAELQRILDRNALLSALPAGKGELVAAARLPPDPEEPPAQGQVSRPPQSVQQQMKEQRRRSQSEQRARFEQNVENVAPFEIDSWPAMSGVSGGALQPLWVGEALLLARRVNVRGEDYIQGCQLDWPGIKQWLTTDVRDLLPEVDLEPVKFTPRTGKTRMLAALPMELIPGTVPSTPGQPVSVIRLSLVIAWICVVLAAAAVAVLLMGTISLSERRAAFVSAVTHEMRTPLTTFRMYTDMLLKGMIPDEAKQRRYLDTLRTEAQRLSHLVENVLAYARLERNRRLDRAEIATLPEVIARVQDRLAARADQAGMELVVDTAGPASRRRVRLDPSAVEQILFNLVDNACKYAASGTERRIHLEIDAAGERVALRVRDHGPGISRPDARRLFRPFSKSAREAAHSAPGVGLGLALSRRLARHMGGDLHLDQTVPTGACFVLTLPAA